MKRISRRTFVKTAVAAGGATALAGRCTMAAPNARIRGANDDIRIAVVGIGSNVKIGGKGKGDIRDWLKIPGVRVVAVCDVDRTILDAEVEKFRSRNEKVEAYVDVRELLDNPDIDAVSITTPNHWHSLVTVWACQAGKDVFVQKPASHNIFEGRKMVEAARKYDRIVQSTHGPRGTTGIGEAFEFVRSGRLGRILYSHGLNYRPRISIGKVAGPQPIPPSVVYDLWSGPAPILPIEREYMHYDWHWIWEYGNGDLGNMGIHYMDACRWALDEQALPPRVLSVGGRFGYDDDGQTPNTLITLLDYEPAPLIFEVRGLPKNAELRKTNWERNAGQTMDSYMGERIAVIVHCENGYVAQNKAFDNDGNLIQEFEPTNIGTKTNFIQAMRSRRMEDLSCDVLQGHLSAGLVHMANISHRAGSESTPDAIREVIEGEKQLADAWQRLQAHLDANEIDLSKHPITLGASLTMDPETERFTGPMSERANALATRDYRRPFVVPEKV